ncbi:hypothetical protein ES707_13412 [subsurface metagenome]
MQWLIDITKEWLELYLKGMIVMWSGSTLDIPEGWGLCTGANGTPDLREKFIYSSGPTVLPHVTGGETEHTHPFTTDGHYHGLLSGLGIETGAEFQDGTDTKVDTGTTDPMDHIPPFYALAFIMKL